MKGFSTLLAAFALLVPTLTFAQDVKTAYRPEVHGTIAVMPPTAAVPGTKAVKRAPTPQQVIERNYRWANAYRVEPRVNYPAVAQRERAIAKAQAQLRRRS